MFSIVWWDQIFDFIYYYIQKKINFIEYYGNIDSS